MARKSTNKKSQSPQTESDDDLLASAEAVADAPALDANTDPAASDPVEQPESTEEASPTAEPVADAPALDANTDPAASEPVEQPESAEETTPPVEAASAPATAAPAAASGVGQFEIQDGDGCGELGAPGDIIHMSNTRAASFLDDGRLVRV